jgi:aminopeptidase N
MRAIQRKKKPKWNPSFLVAATEVAQNKSLEPAFRAVAIQLPSESELARIVGRNVDPDAIYSARKSLLSALGEKLEPLREDIIKALEKDPEFSPTSQEAGKRDLSNLLLAYGVYANSERAEKENIKQFKNADNMNDKEYAFRLILQEMSDTSQAQKAIRAFYNEFKSDPIVLDKWFTLQAMRGDTKSIEHVKDLVAHKDFSWTNPNRVRSVIGAFATGNPTGFNRLDGSGYRFVADAVLKLDRINPQVASRLLTAFRSWRLLDPARRKIAEAVLLSMKKTRNLSRDVNEILERTLAF